MIPARRLVIAAGVVAGALIAVGSGGLATPPGDVSEVEAWVDRVGGPAAGLALARVLAIIGCAYLIAVVTLVAVADRVRWARGARWTIVLMPPPLRRALGAGGAAAVIAIGADVVPVVAADPSVRVDDGAPVGADAPPTAEMRPLPPDPSEPIEPTAPSVEVRRPAVTRPSTRIIEAGDHLWSVAAHALEDAWGATPCDAEVTRYWADVVDENRSRLVDPTEPDLIFPGQEIRLPDPGPAPS